MKILAFEFSSDHRSVALAEIGATARILSEASVSGIRSTPALGLVDEVLRQANESRDAIEALVVGLGPGSYTGIRIAIATGQGWQLARSIKLLGISSVEALAARAQEEGLRGRVGLAIDAQRGEFYLTNYDITGSERRVAESLRLVSRDEIEQRLAAGETIVGPDLPQLSALETPRSLTPALSPDGGEGVRRTGEGDGQRYASLEHVHRARPLFPRAADLARLAVGRNDFVDGEKLEPVYLREVSFVKAPPPRIVP